jgi:hypothetical protein
MVQFENIGTAETLRFNAALAQKKNELRKLLKEKGVLAKGGTNKFDGYKYFTEAQYKELFTELLSVVGLELSFTELEYNTFSGSEKQANGRMPRIMFILTDIETGYYEETIITGEGIDKGDKAGYKAYTGALKYYLANTFMVATGDDPETESPAHTMNAKEEKKATPKQIELMQKIAGEQGKTLDMEVVKNWSMKQASDFISKYKGGAK